MFTADLTGNDFVINRQESGVETASSLLWIRCVPAKEKTDALSDFSKPEHRTMQYHFDSDVTLDNNFDTAEEFCLKQFALIDSDAEMLSNELFLEAAHPEAINEEVHCVGNAHRVWNTHITNLYRMKKRSGRNQNSNGARKRVSSLCHGQCIEQPAEWNVVKRLGHKEHLEELATKRVRFYRNYRMLKLDEIDISLFSPNWRG